MDEIVITGAGIVSAIGVGKAETLASLRQGRTGIGSLHYLQTIHRDFPVGEVKLSNDEMKQRLGITTEPTNRSALLGMLALQEALSEAGIRTRPQTLPFINGTTVGGMDKTEQLFIHYLEATDHSNYIRLHDCGATTNLIADYFKLFTTTACVSTACSSAANAIVMGADMIRCRQTEIAVVGGAECLTKFHLNGFNTLMILDHEQCRPFDKTRAGLNLGEGAAYLVIETLESARRRGATILATLSGYGNACDAYHQTATSDNGEGPFLAMEQALRMAGLQPRDIGYVNAHGTGTPNNDQSESRALQRLFGDQMPPVSSTKGMTGHTTSASGAVETVICLLALRHQLLPVNYGWHTPMDDGIVPITHCTSPTALHSAPLTHVMCNSFGFGGNDTSLILSSVAGAIDAVDTIDAIDTIASKRIFIRAAAQISMQQPLSEQWLTGPETYTEPYVRSIDPNFRQWLSPLESRRMGRLLKRALVTAMKVMADSHVALPDAIVTGTGLGCLENTEQFLTQLCTDGEQMLKPTSFMQSTHNTISSLIAIHSRCHGYNSTYSQGTLSFDYALYDAYLQLLLGDISNALVTGNDELTPTYFPVQQRSGYVGQPGQVPAGEASVAMLLTVGDGAATGSAANVTNAPADVLCELESLKIVDGSHLSTSHFSTSQPFDLLVLGTNGTVANDAFYNKVAALLPGVPCFDYKRLFGESYTASGLGLYAAANLIKSGKARRLLFVNSDDHNACWAVLKAVEEPKS